MTRLLVLGLLDQGPMSGYDLQQTIRGADAERWGGVLTGSIYHALKKLEQERHIALADLEQRGHRQKAVYQITDQGREYLHGLILDSLREPAVHYPTTLFSGLSFLDKIPRDQARRALGEQRKRLNEEYGALERGQRTNQDSREEVPPVSRLTIAHMFAVIRLRLEFIESLLEALEDGAE